MKQITNQAMKQNRKTSRIQGILFGFILLGLLFLPVQTAHAANPKMSSSRMTLTVGESKKLALKKGNKNVTRSAKWTSGKSSVASVSSTGKVIAKKAGKATIKAKYKKKTYKCTVTVLAKPRLSHSELTIKMGSTSSIFLKQGSNTISSGVVWSSGNVSVARVSGGNIIPVKPGNATITATYKKQMYLCHVTVIRGQALSINKQSLELYTGAVTTLAVNNLLSTDSVSWASNNKSVVTVNEKGVVTAQKEGTAKITATVTGADKTYYLSCQVTVKRSDNEVVRSQKPSINIQSAELYEGEEISLSINNLLSTDSVSWASNNKSVVTVNEKGVVTAQKEGTAKITATVTGVDNIYSLTCQIIVTHTDEETTDPDNEPAIDSREQAPSISKETIELCKGDNTTLTLNNLLSSDSVSWTSDNEKVVEINEDGVLTAKEEGTAKIKAAVVRKGDTYSLFCEVSVLNLDANAEILFATTDGGVYIREESTAVVKFHLDKLSKNIKVSIKNADDEVVAVKDYDTLTANQEQSFTWNTDTVGSYYVEIKAGETISKSNILTVNVQEFAGGTGSTENPFRVSTLEQFNLVNEYSTYNFIQINDIDGELNSIAGICKSDNMFSGSYNGDGYTIANLFVQDSTDQSAALFKNIAEGASVTNLTIDNLYVSNDLTAGVLVVHNYGTIKNCYVKACNLTTSPGRGQTALLCAVNESTGAIINCKISDSTLSSTYSSAYASHACVGGVCSRNYGKIVSTSIERSSLKATNTWGDQAYLGCITSYNHGSILNCTVSEVNTLTAFTNNYNNKTRGKEAIYAYENDGTISNCSYSDMEITETITKNTGTYIE